MKDCTIVAHAGDVIPFEKTKDDRYLPGWLSEKEREEFLSIGIWERKHVYAVSRLIAKLSYYLYSGTSGTASGGTTETPPSMNDNAADILNQHIQVWDKALLDKELALLPEEFIRTTWVYKDDSGCPYIRRGNTSIPLSISHSKELVAVICSGTSLVGIDIQAVEERPLYFYEEAFNVEELMIIQKSVSLLEDEPAYINGGFSAKEACFKAMRINRADWQKEIMITYFRPPVFTGWDIRTNTRFEGRITFLSSASGGLYSLAVASIIP